MPVRSELSLLHASETQNCLASVQQDQIKLILLKKKRGKHIFSICSETKLGEAFSGSDTLFPPFIYSVSQLKIKTKFLLTTCFFDLDFHLLRDIVLVVGSILRKCF